MTIQFICRGNAFRSRMAEAYFNSLNVPGKHAISSGSVADLHSHGNTHNFEITQSILVGHGLEKYTKDHWTQLTQQGLSDGDITVCLSQSVKDECDQLFTMPPDTLVWNVPDFDEVTPIPQTDDELDSYAEDTYQLISHNVDTLVASWV